jgi:hypothetical protein
MVNVSDIPVEMQIIGSVYYGVLLECLSNSIVGSRVTERPSPSQGMSPCLSDSGPRNFDKSSGSGRPILRARLALA